MSPLPNRSPQSPTPLSTDDSSTENSSAERGDTVEMSQPLSEKPALMQPPARPVRPAPPPASPPPPASIAAPEPVPPVPEPVEEDPMAASRQQPIPAPSEPMQYRAIGLVRGRYEPSDEQFTRGSMTTSDGTLVEAVLLGRVMSLVKNHLDLSQEHVWVVYPRTRDRQEDLHVQIVGVWEPENLIKSDDAEEPVEDEVPSYVPSSEVQDNYFSIRGEIVYHSTDDGSMIVKIQQAPRKKDDRAKAFKLKLLGNVSGKALGYFWDLQVHRQAGNLVVQQGTSIGMIPPRKKPKFEGRSDFRGGARGGSKPPFRQRTGSAPGRPMGATPPPAPKRDAPLPKPVKKSERAESAETAE
ncbi:hypothetical protein [Myxacorys almedinensis]|uniref:Uncharacterized protein n=1 Tax=Myxacorys almedinensis A TaxID=2690445 RepID=A0A8J8CKY5_9CYAN|nr:hypothetical protein [Myxacorys almedinensis]NDJ19071.1 hypothetical protein [Myxacorys almedinensis A]